MKIKSIVQTHGLHFFKYEQLIQHSNKEWKALAIIYGAQSCML